MWFKEANISFDLYVYIGQSVELRCETNDSSKFTRIQHHQLNGTIETLLSNDYLNSKYKNSEIHVAKVKQYYIVRIDPVRLHTAGVYTCEDNVSLQNKNNHIANITVHVIPVHANNPYRILQKETERFNFFRKNLHHNYESSNGIKNMSIRLLNIFLLISTVFFICY